jgi:hypothetical protein
MTTTMQLIHVASRLRPPRASDFCVPYEQLTTEHERERRRHLLQAIPANDFRALLSTSVHDEHKAEVTSKMIQWLRKQCIVRDRVELLAVVDDVFRTPTTPECEELIRYTVEVAKATERLAKEVVERERQARERQERERLEQEGQTKDGATVERMVNEATNKLRYEEVRQRRRVFINEKANLVHEIASREDTQAPWETFQARMMSRLRPPPAEECVQE